MTGGLQLLEQQISPALLFLLALVLVALFVRDIPGWLFERRTRRALNQLRRSVLELAAAEKALDKRVADLGADHANAADATSASAFREQRRFCAEQMLWDAVVDLNQLKRLGKAAYDRKLEVLIDAASHDKGRVEEVHGVATELLGTHGLADDGAHRWRLIGETTRPFVANLLWAYFATYRALLLLALERVAVARNGSLANGSTPIALSTAVGTLIPELKTAIERSGSSGFPLLYDTFEARIRTLLSEGSPAADDDHLSATVLSLLDAHERGIGPEARVPVRPV